MANFYKRPLIYLPRKKNIVQQDGSVSFGAFASEHYYLKQTITGANLVTFWLTPQARRTTTVPPLYLYDPGTHRKQEVNFSEAWHNTSHRLYMCLLRLNYTPSNISTTIWADPKNWLSNVGFSTIFLYVSFTNADNHLYKISSTDMFNTYRMLTHTTIYQLTNSNGNVRGVTMDETRYSNILNNQTIQNTISGHNVYGSRLIYFQTDITDEEMLNICEIYEMPGVTAVEPLTI